MDVDWTDVAQADWGQAAPLAPLQQSHAYGTAMAALGARVGRARLIQAGQVVGQAQVLDRRGLRVINRGPVMRMPGDAGAGLRALARWPGLTLATPDLPLAGPTGLRLLAPRQIAIWDLTPDPAALRAGLSGKWRNRLVRAERMGVVPLSGGLAARRDLLRAEAAQARARGYRALPPEFALAWPGDWALWQWRSGGQGQGGQMQAGMLFLIHGQVATYHVGWASDAGRAVFAHGPILWQAALALRARGVRRLDLGGVDPQAAPGLAHFKAGTGARITRMGATLLILPALGGWWHRTALPAAGQIG